MVRPWLLLSIALGLTALGASWASYDDGSHNITVQGDWGVLGQIKETPEDGTVPVDDYMFRQTTDLAMDSEIDALSSGAHPWVTLSRMFAYEVDLLYSVDGGITGADDTDSDIYWVRPTGPVNPSARLVHDLAADLGLADDPAKGLYYDLDGIESEAHSGAFWNFPSHGEDPEYFSVAPGGTLDPGAIYSGLNWDSGSERYLDHALVMSRADLGLDVDEDLEDLIFFNQAYDHPVYGSGNQWAFFTVPGGQNGDPIGDNVYVSRGDGNNYLWYDPLDNRNWDALDVVPEPGTMALMGFGLAGLALVRRRRKS